MPRRLLIGLLLMLAAYGAVMVLLPNVSPRAATAYSCGPTAPNVAPAKLQIRVYGERANEVNWAFNVSPNPFTFSGILKVIDNQSPDIGLTRSDMLLEGVCTQSLPNESYTVSLDPGVIPPCPMVQTVITQPAPLPTNPNSNPNTAAFYFTMQCPPPTPTPLPTATPVPATPTPLPISAIVTVSVTTSVSANGVTTTTSSNGTTTTSASDTIPCNGSALVTVRAYQGINPVPNGTLVQLSTTIGSLGQNSGTTTGGVFQTPLTLPRLTSSQFGNVRATVGSTGAQAPAASFTAQACEAETLSAPPPGSVLRPPNTGDAGLR